jgi:hypothetical protein
MGAAGGQDIVAAITPDNWAHAVVVLSADYHRAPPSEFPDPNPGSDVGKSFTAFPMTIHAGATLSTFAPEAAALVAAGAASYA